MSTIRMWEGPTHIPPVFCPQVFLMHASGRDVVTVALVGTR